jgi:hypothetical protein
MWSAYSNLSLVVNRVGQMHCSQKKVLPTSPLSPAKWPRLNFSPNTTIETVCLSQAPVDSRLLGLLGQYHQQAISTFNTCSRRPTHRSLTDTDKCYNLEGASLPHHTPQPSRTTVLHFPSKGTARSQVNHPTITNGSREGSDPKSHEWEPPLDFYHNLTSKHSMS